MRRIFSAGKLAWLLTAVIAFNYTTVRAQITHVDFDLSAFNYDVVYLADFIDISSNKLAKNIPNFSGTITPVGSGQIILVVMADLRLKGDPAPVNLVRAETEPFTLNSSRSITANDLAGLSSDIVMKGGSDYYENAALRQRLTDYAAKFPTAPVGDYILTIQAYSVVGGIKSNTPIGSKSITITVRNASPEEVQVNLNQPQPGEVITTTQPTFSWNSPYPKATIYVYEMLPIYQSPQEAITGIPYVKKDIDGPPTYVYDGRQLEWNKSYVWFVEVPVTTNRQTIERRSEVRLFRIRLNDQTSQAIADMMNGFGGGTAGTFATLQSIGWGPNGTITLDGKTLTLDELKALVAKLIAQNVQVTVRVE